MNNDQFEEICEFLTEQGYNVSQMKLTEIIETYASYVRCS